MKTWEMIKELTENPKLKFKRLCDSRIFYCGNSGYLYREPGMSEVIGIDEDWELISQEVTWQEAIQAWVDGKTVRCKKDREIIYFGSWPDFIADKTNFTDGKWYIE
ncbi:hypothetical protein E4K67_22635 [Desulfosporosinus fructosivorans]|uniref:Uncharacterized protein n=1 Tax=Desulfosporosinus fructosivorans TaxID=2018669 RepID=A0A4Z0R2Q0_9FIRM|nr:hypothetical protein [Desulfosporosinus fructosivorans]TGE35916.1 hypothetical protein E4K67_22635 [Desulfosporosinus fructosivorans]